MAFFTNCEGTSRRDFLKVGAIGATGLTMGNYMRLAQAGQVKEATAKAAIFINLTGGPSHMDTFDLKPEATDEYRGDFKPIDTNVPGIQISEHLPKLAGCMNLFTILRGVSHTLGAHRLGSEYVNTGNRPLPSIEFPGYGAVLAKELESPRDIPPFVSIPKGNQKPGFLGVKYAPLNTGSVPVAGRPYAVRGIELSNGLTITEVEKRQSLLRDLDSTFRGLEKNSQLIEGLDQFSQQAYDMITSKASREAFDISRESADVSGLFGEDGFDQSCLLATRLVEAGTRFVTIELGGWDTHRDNWNNLKDSRLPRLDSGLSGLFKSLEMKGMLDSTIVYVTGEFGRTPKINTERVGRDHYPRCMFMLMAGGGVPGGRVLGESNENATLPKDEVGYSPDDVAASFYHALGIDHHHEYHTNTGRPIMVVRDGNVIEELFS